jgi:hypothetical protein
MKQHSKLSSEQQQQHTAEHQVQQRTGREFATPEELLRFDAAQTGVPVEIAKRLAKSAEGLPSPSRSWWRRIFNR